MKKYKCAVCPYIYDPAKGDPTYGTDQGIAPGTPFEELPEDWFCPDCGGEKALFEVVE
jgi:rubredoxin